MRGLVGLVQTCPQGSALHNMPRMRKSESNTPAIIIVVNCL